jgi:hypothetical protein
MIVFAVQGTFYRDRVYFLIMSPKLRTDWRVINEGIGTRYKLDTVYEVELGIIGAALLGAALASYLLQARPPNPFVAFFLAMFRN